MIIQESNPYVTTETVYQKILMVILVLQMFVKILFFFKIYENYGFLVQMVQQSVIDASPFMGFYALWVLFFTVEGKLLKWEYDDKEYSELPEFF